jgi:hypothetical protein
MADLQNRAAMADLESTISRLRGVLSVRVVSDDRREIAEIHVVADESRHPKQLSRDIESALFSELGIRVDHRKISIAQVRGGGEPAADVRLKFLSIDYSLDRATSRVRVSVGVGDQSFTGIASMPAGGKQDQEELVARATIQAVQEFLHSTSLNGQPTGLELRDFTKSQSNGSPCFIVTVRVLAERGDQDLIGSALVRDEPWKAAACATLDALNRRLPALRA